MALESFGRTLTAQQIVALAEVKAGSPRRHLDAAGAEVITAPAYIQLQAILDDLAENYDWPYRDDAVTLSVTSRFTTLPGDFWRSVLPTAYVIDSIAKTRTELYLVGHDEGHTGLTQTTEGLGTPTRGTIYRNRGASAGGVPEGVLMVDPAPDHPVMIELHYQPQAVALPTIGSRPWLPKGGSQYLVAALLCELYLDQDDSRFSAAVSERERLFRRMRHGLDIPGERGPRRIPLSPTRFRPPQVP